MKRINKYISLILTMVIIFMTINIKKVNAASATLSASSLNVTVGTTVTLTATVTAGAWNITISGNGVNKQLVGQTDSVGNKTVTTSATFTPQSKGEYTFDLSGDITDFSEDNAKKVSGSVTINVTEPETTPEPEPEPTPDPEPTPFLLCITQSFCLLPEQPGSGYVLPRSVQFLSDHRHSFEVH